MLVRSPIPLLADVGVPMIFLTFPLMIGALIPVIAVEIWIAKPLLGTSYRRTTWIVSVANVASTIIGVPAAWVAMFALEFLGGEIVFKLTPARSTDGPEMNAVFLLLGSAWLGPGSNLYWAVPLAALILLIPTFFASWYIEAFIVDQMVDRDWPDVRTTTFKANLASYALLYVGGCVWLIVSVIRWRPH